MTERWRSTAGYPDPRQTSLAQWAWEFLRRNPDYRADWQLYQAQCAELRRKYGAEIADEEPTSFAFERDDAIGCAYEPPRLVAETEEAWMHRCGKVTRMPLGAWLCAKWGIAASAPKNPASRTFRWPWSWSTSKTRVREITHEEPERKRPLTRRTLRYPEYDLTRPLEPQFAAVKRHLVAQQQVLLDRGLIDGSRAHGRAGLGRTYQRYLRALDAVDESGCPSHVTVRAAVLRVIGGVLFPDDDNPLEARPLDQKMRATIRAARHLRDSGYRLLPSLAVREK